ncbi:unnamed protein product [Prunus armeniaca]|uniref:Uncharacterized protein n=1 Tax=Prunus armeniaca TaxID=36596 RepID=A0A6J5XGU7_PRUAR|nr:unnamed protein product [Prunus armeniaca]CAB4311837.1 unnamed protein product [Prunus armeniaca]
MAFGMNNKLRINTALVAFMLLLLLLLFIVVCIADDGTGTGGVNDKVASLVEDEAAKTKTTKTKTKQETNLMRGEDLDLLVMDYTPARKKSPIHN